MGMMRPNCKVSVGDGERRVKNLSFLNHWVHTKAFTEIRNSLSQEISSPSNH